MQSDVREHQYLKAGVALAVASVIAAAPITPVTPLPSALSAVQRAVRLAAEDSILNVPFNLFQDVVNVPANEVEAIDEAAKSLFFAGNWWTPSATNLWGTDPGDYGHYAAIFSLLFPFREISGLGAPEIDSTALADGTAGLGQQFNLLAAAEFQTSASSDADWSSPLVPATPITGVAAWDRSIFSLMAFSGQQQFPLLDNWFKVPLSDLSNGYTFDDSDIGPDHDLGILADPSMGVGPNGAVLPSMGFDGTKPLLDADGDPVLNEAGNPINLMPWAGETFKLNLFGPFQQFFQSLQAPVDSSDFGFNFGLPADLPGGLAAPLTGFTLPSFQDVIWAFQALMASSVVAFDPWVPGSPVCIGACLTGGFPALVNMVELINGGPNGTNPIINTWLDQVHAENTNGVGGDNPNLDMTGIQSGLSNAATPHQIFTDTQYLQGDQNFGWDFGNPGPDDPPLTGPYGVDTPISFQISPALQNLIDFMKTSGIQDLVRQWADNNGYTPIDYFPDGDGGASDSAAAAATAATDVSTWTDLANPADWGNLF